MAYNGSGTFVLVAGNPVVTGTTISSTWANNTLNDIATGLSTAITKDGQTTPTANIPMGGYKITGLAAATVNGDAVRYEQAASLVQAQTGVYFTTGGTTTAYTLTPTPALGSLIAGQRFNVVFNAANTTTTPTLAISGQAATAIKVYNSAGAKVDPVIGALALNMISDVVYDGTNYVVLDQLPITEEPVNVQTGTTYTYLTGDRGKLVTHSNAAAIAGTLPQAGVTFTAGWCMDVQNRGAGTLTITPTTSTIDGAATLVLATNQGVRIVSDGTNYYTMRGLAVASSSSVRVQNSNGYGSTNTMIKRYSNVLDSVGTAITYADSATLGASFTINTTGSYAISITSTGGATNTFGASKNSAQLTTNVASITAADRLVLGFTGGGNASPGSATVYLTAGDVVRPHCDSTASGTAAQEQFVVTGPL
jgi:hypothetical protein